MHYPFRALSAFALIKTGKPPLYSTKYFLRRME